jgi:hypothetical protein
MYIVYRLFYLHPLSSPNRSLIYAISFILFFIKSTVFNYQSSSNLRTGSAVRLHTRRELYNKEEDVLGI